jgi:hypothetical protein
MKLSYSPYQYSILLTVNISIYHFIYSCNHATLGVLAAA